LGVGGKPLDVSDLPGQAPRARQPVVHHPNRDGYRPVCLIHCDVGGNVSAQPLTERLRQPGVPRRWLIGRAEVAEHPGHQLLDCRQVIAPSCPDTYSRHLHNDGVIEDDAGSGGLPPRP
jgi:hypothetical protein